VYLPSDAATFPPSREMENLVEYCQNKSFDLVMGCDSNAHHINWGSNDNNARGKSLYDYIINKNLSILNKGNKPTFINSRSQTLIDITLSTTKISKFIHNWQVSDEVSMSDHCWLKFDINLTLTTSTLQRDPKRTDREQFSHLLEGALREVEAETPNNHDDLEKYVVTIQNIINKAYKKSCPLRLVQKSTGTPWWCQELEQLRKTARKSFNKAKNTKSEEDWDLYRSHLKEYKKVVRQKQREAWRAYCEEIEDFPQAARLQRALTKDPYRSVGALTKEDGTTTANLEESIQLLMTTHFPGSTTTDETVWAEEVIQIPSENDWEIAKSIVDENRIRWAISSFSPFKSPGPDGIYPALLQWGLGELLPHLVGVFRSSLALRYIPKVWREVKVVFIPKPGRVDYSTPKSYRPISLTSFSMKTLERLCERHIRDTVIITNPLHPNQHAYTPGRSTDTALHLVAGRIEKSLDNKQSTLGVFIDIEGAFDKTTFPKIADSLASRNVPGVISGWIHNMLSKRAIKITVDDITLRGLVVRGCPQGGVLSPLLWNMVLDSLLNRLNNDNFYTIAYADDLVILQTGRFENILCERMQVALKSIEQWCEDHSLSANPKKTEMVLFTRKRKLPNLKAPELLKIKLNFSTEVKYLGIIFDQKLTWNSHLEKRVKKAYISYEQCRRTMGQTWGLTPRIALWIYTAIIRPMLTYGAVVWGPKAQQTTAIRKLDQIQRLACLYTTGAMRTTPTRAMEVILGLTPLDIHVREVVLMTMHRFRTVGIEPEVGAGESRRRLWYEALSSLPMLQANTDSIAPRFVFHKPYKICISNTTEESAVADTICIYTDGSKTEHGSGCGVYSTSLNLKIKWAMGKYANVVQTELNGIYIAAKEISGKNISEKNICIYTDSRQALLALERPRITQGSVLECHEALVNASGNNMVTLKWIKGHGKYKGNHIADKLARRAAGERLLEPAPSASLTTSAVVNQIREHSQILFRKRWDETRNCSLARELLHYPDQAAARKFLAMTRQNLRFVTGILTGHCHLNKHLHRMMVSDTPLCRGCKQEDETMEHILCDCPALSSTRKAVFDEFWLTPANIREAHLGDVINYVKTVGWLTS
jgi:ribonuclease HI